jgi:hypothetical protein
MWYFVVLLIGVMIGIYIGNEKTRNKVNSGFKKLRDKMKENKLRRKEGR